MNSKSLFLICAILFTLLACSQEKSVQTGTARVAAQPSVAPAESPVADANLAVKLCGVLKKVAPDVRVMSPVGAQAQLVMAIAGAFDVNAAALKEVSEKIDVVASESCSPERDILLSVLKMKSLQEAVR